MTKLNPTAFYNETGRQHFGVNYGIAPPEKDIVFQAVSKINPKGTVVELACGDARVMKGLLKSGFDIHGYDASQTMLNMAVERNIPRERLTLLDIYKTPLPFSDNTVDVTFCSRTLSYLHDPIPAIKELLRVTKPGHHVLIDFFHEQEAVKPKETKPTHGNNLSGNTLYMSTYSFSAKTLIAKAREDFEITRIDVLENSKGSPIQDAKRPELKRLPDGYVFLQLQKAM